MAWCPLPSPSVVAVVTVESEERGKQAAENTRGEVIGRFVTDATTINALKMLHQNIAWYFVWFYLFLPTKYIYTSNTITLIFAGRKKERKRKRKKKIKRMKTEL